MSSLIPPAFTASWITLSPVFSLDSKSDLNTPLISPSSDTTPKPASVLINLPSSSAFLSWTLSIVPSSFWNGLSTDQNVSGLSDFTLSILSMYWVVKSFPSVSATTSVVSTGTTSSIFCSWILFSESKFLFST